MVGARRRVLRLALRGLRGLECLSGDPHPLLLTSPRPSSINDAELNDGLSEENVA